MGYNLSEKDELDIICGARRFELDRVILFGSRARGDNWEKSDVDLAVSGKNAEQFKDLAPEILSTPYLIDVVNLDRRVSDKLIRNILRDGVLIYAKD